MSSGGTGTIKNYFDSLWVWYKCFNIYANTQDGSSFSGSDAFGVPDTQRSVADLKMWDLLFAEFFKASLSDYIYNRNHIERKKNARINGAADRWGSMFVTL